MGRQLVDDDVTEGICYFEWSAELDDDIEDPATWRKAMPALGVTVDERTIAADLTAMLGGAEIEGFTGADGFRRAYLNVSTSTENAVIPLVVWQAVCDPALILGAPAAFGVDCNPERTAAAVCAADGDDRVELVEFRPGVGWVPERLAELSAKWKAPVAVDPSGPAGMLIPDIVARGVSVVEVAGREMAQAAGDLFVSVGDGVVSVRSDPMLDAAVLAARRRDVGDAWVWARRDLSSDVCPLVALTVARWAAKHHRVASRSPLAVWA
jgi:hypothetical protein